VLEAVKKHIEHKFGLNSESNILDNALYVRVPGLNNYSLAKWIDSEFIHAKVEVDFTRSYEYSDAGWIKVQNELESNDVAIRLDS
jgi:hypothetical protein